MRPKDDTTPPITEPNEPEGKRPDEAVQKSPSEQKAERAEAIFEGEEAEALDRAEQEAMRDESDLELYRDLDVDDFSDIGES
jgi:hypothetical protein